MFLLISCGSVPIGFFNQAENNSLIKRTLTYNNSTLWNDGSNENRGNIEPNFYLSMKSEPLTMT